MAKLHEVLAVEPNVKGKSDEILREALNTFRKKDALFTGLSRTYTPKDDEGEKFPDESLPVSENVKSKLAYVFKELIARADLIATKEHTNTLAKADITVDGNVLVQNVPATTLLMLEKEIKKWRELVLSVPTLEPQVNWSFDKDNNIYRTEEKKTLKSQKESVVLVKYEATPEHPAQTEIVTKDVFIGEWTTVHLSGKISSAEKAEIITKIDKLEVAVKQARQRANEEKVTQQKIGKILVDYFL